MKSLSTLVLENSPFSERKILDGQIEEWLEQGIVEPCQSEYASQAVLVKKKWNAQGVLWFSQN